MPIDPNDLRTGGALQGAVAASLIRARESASELAPGALVGPYRVLRELGRGGMAIVYLAERADGEYEQHVALKWMQSAHVDPAGEALFRRERQSLADLRHPHVARLLDGGRTSADRLWFAMEYIDGAPLDRHCVQRALPLRQRLALFQQVCAAVAFAHARGVLHRDLKPSNVLVDADGSAKLLDFGIAQLIGQDDALALRAFTPGFASPEQARGEALTVASDTYQLGRLLAALLSADDTERATVATQILDHPQAVGSAQPVGRDSSRQTILPRDLAPDLTAILHKACADEAAQRYATAEALASDVQAFLDHRPVTARPQRAIYLAARFLQRHPLTTSLAAAGLALLVATVSIFTWRLAQERDKAQLEAERAEAGEDFLISLFRVSDPGVGRGEKLSATQLLDAGAQRLQNERAAMPATRARLLLTLAEVFFSLGELDRAQTLAQTALEVEPEGAHRFHIQALELRIAQRAGRTSEALESAPTLLAALPPGREYDAVRARVLNTAARAAVQSGDDRAMAWQTAAFEAATRAGDEEAQGHALRSLAYLHDLRGDYATALRHAEAAISHLRAALGETSPEVFGTRATRIHYLSLTDQPELALREYRQLAREVDAVLAPGHISRIYLDVVGAKALRDAGQFEEALRLIEPTARRCEATLGVTHIECGFAVSTVGIALLDLDRGAEARPWLERLVEARRNTMGAQHIYVAYEEQWLARSYCLTGDVSRGLELAQRVAARFRRELPPEVTDHADATRTIALCEQRIEAAKATGVGGR